MATPESSPRTEDMDALRIPPLCKQSAHCVDRLVRLARLCLGYSGHGHRSACPRHVHHSPVTAASCSLSNGNGILFPRGGLIYLPRPNTDGIGVLPMSTFAGLF